MNEQSEVASIDAEESIGARLRRAREGKGLSVEELAARLRVPQQVVCDAERDCFERLGAAVYVRGHLRATCRELSLSEQLAACYGGAVEQPTLQPMVKASLFDRLLEHSTRSLVYIVLTASIGIPVVWFALRSPQNAGVATHLTQLDPLPAARPGVVETASAAASPAQIDGSTAAIAAPTASAAPAGAGSESQGAPLVASLSGFLDTPAVGAPPTPAVAAAGDASLVLTFQATSWVEVRDAQGRAVDELIAKPGDSRRYALGPGVRVVLGNASGVAARVGERAIDIGAFQRANVARFAVSSQGEVALDRD